MIIWQIQYFGVRARSWVRLPKAWYIWLPQNTTPNSMAQFISNQMCIWDMILEIAQKSNKKGPNVPGQINSKRMYIWEMMLEIAPKSNQKGPNKPARLISTLIYVWEMILKIAPKSNKKGPNTPARFISTRMYTERIFVPVFTNFAATLVRQPSAASLALRSNYAY